MLAAMTLVDLASNVNMIFALSWRGRGLATSQFKGVNWEFTAQKFRARVWVKGRNYEVGYFHSEAEAAHARDGQLRNLCQDQARLKRTLNFPTKAEELFEESPAEARARGLAMPSARANEAEKKSVERLGAMFRETKQSAASDIIPISGASKVDAIFHPKGSSGGGLCLQLKASNSRAGCRGSYTFQKMNGYYGMLLILVPLDLAGVVWAVPGSSIVQKVLHIQIGSPRDLSWRATDIAETLVECFQKPERFPHVTLAEAALQCSINHCVEEKAHRLMARVFTFVKFELKKSLTAASAVDSVLRSASVGEWNVQEKATRGPKHAGRSLYQVHLSKHGGALGRIAYEERDFEVLLVAILDTEMLVGMFVFPVHVLAKRELVGQRPRSMILYPPWSLPSRLHYRLRHAWQLDYFLDLREWDGNSSLDAATLSRLLALVQNLPTRDNRTGA